MMGRHQYLNEDEYEVNLKDFEPQPGEFVNNLTCFDLLKLLCQLLQCSYHELRMQEQSTYFYFMYII